MTITGADGGQGTAGLLESPKWAGLNVFTADETAEILRISVWATYEAIKRNEIPTIKIGRRYVVPRRALERLLSGEAPVPVPAAG